MKKIMTCFLTVLFITESFCSSRLFSEHRLVAWDFPQKQRKEKSENAGETLNDKGFHQKPLLSAERNADLDLPVQYPSAEFNPVLEPGMILVLELLDRDTKQVFFRSAVPVMHDEVVTVPGVGVLEIVGKKLTAATDLICKFVRQDCRVGLMMGNVQTVQVLGKVQKPGNYPGYMKLSYIIAEAMDRSSGSNFRVHFFNGASRETSSFRYEDIVKGKNNPLAPPGSILYFPPSASALFGEMTEKQINIAYLVVVTLATLGITAIVRN